MPAITKLLANIRLIGFQARSENNGTDMEVILFVFILEIDSIGITYLFTFTTNTFIQIKAMVTVYRPGVRYRLGEKSIDSPSLI